MFSSSAVQQPKMNIACHEHHRLGPQFHVSTPPRTPPVNQHPDQSVTLAPPPSLKSLVKRTKKWTRSLSESQVSDKKQAHDDFPHASSNPTSEHFQPGITHPNTEQITQTARRDPSEFSAGRNNKARGVERSENRQQPGHLRHRAETFPIHHRPEGIQGTRPAETWPEHGQFARPLESGAQILHPRLNIDEAMGILDEIDDDRQQVLTLSPLDRVRSDLAREHIVTRQRNLQREPSISPVRGTSRPRRPTRVEPAHRPRSLKAARSAVFEPKELPGLIKAPPQNAPIDLSVYFPAQPQQVEASSFAPLAKAKTFTSAISSSISTLISGPTPTNPPTPPTNAPTPSEKALGKRPVPPVPHPASKQDPPRRVPERDQTATERSTNQPGERSRAYTLSGSQPASRQQLQPKPNPIVSNQNRDAQQTPFRGHHRTFSAPGAVEEHTVPPRFRHVRSPLANELLAPGPGRVADGMREAMLNGVENASQSTLNLSDYTDVDPEEWDCSTGRMLER